MPHYTVTWTTDIEADSPHEAALQAQTMQRDGESSANCFEVHGGGRKWKMDLDEDDYVGRKVLDRNLESLGIATGSRRKCQLEGCPSQRIGVRWPDGRLTWPCLKGMTAAGRDALRIGVA